MGLNAVCVYSPHLPFLRNKGHPSRYTTEPGLAQRQFHTLFRSVLSSLDSLNGLSDKLQGIRLVGNKDPHSDMAKRSPASNAKASRRNKKWNLNSPTNDAFDSEEEEVPKIASAGTLSKLATARNLVKNTRLRTIAISFDATFRESLSVQQRKELLYQIEKDANALGVLRYLCFMYLAMPAEEETNNANIFKQTFLQQLCTRLSEPELSSKANQIQLSHLDFYLQTHPLPDDIREISETFQSGLATPCVQKI